MRLGFALIDDERMDQKATSRCGHLRYVGNLKEQRLKNKIVGVEGATGRSLLKAFVPYSPFCLRHKQMCGCTSLRVELCQ